MKKKYGKIKMLSEFAKNYKTPEIEYKNNKNNLLKNKDGISNVTNGACIRPDIYLDNDRYCDDCPYYDDCSCDLKRLTKKKNKP